MKKLTLSFRRHSFFVDGPPHKDGCSQPMRNPHNKTWIGKSWHFPQLFFLTVSGKRRILVGQVKRCQSKIRRRDEKNVSAVQCEKSQGSRVQEEDVHQSRQKDFEQKKGQEKNETGSDG